MGLSSVPSLALSFFLGVGVNSLQGKKVLSLGHLRRGKDKTIGTFQW